MTICSAIMTTCIVWLGLLRSGKEVWISIPPLVLSSSANVVMSAALWSAVP